MHPKKPQSPAEAPVAQSDRATVSATVASDAATVRKSARPIVSLPKSREELRAEREALEAETMEQWAARVAPTLDADSWAALRCFEQGVPPSGDCPPQLRSERFHPQGCAALLAYRDSVAAGLTPAESMALAFLASGKPGWGRIPIGLELKVLADTSSGGRVSITNFGREVARVLGGAQ